MAKSYKPVCCIQDVCGLCICIRVERGIECDVQEGQICLPMHVWQKNLMQKKSFQKILPDFERVSQVGRTRLMVALAMRAGNAEKMLN